MKSATEKIASDVCQIDLCAELLGMSTAFDHLTPSLPARRLGASELIALLCAMFNVISQTA